jgi:hypothetical protein
MSDGWLVDPVWVFGTMAVLLYLWIVWRCRSPRRPKEPKTRVPEAKIVRRQ